jgi:flagellar biosynthesis protein FliP
MPQPAVSAVLLLFQPLQVLAALKYLACVVIVLTVFRSSLSSNDTPSRANTFSLMLGLNLAAAAPAAAAAAAAAAATALLDMINISTSA